MPGTPCIGPWHATCDLLGMKLAPANLRRYKDIAALFLKHGRGDLLANAGVPGEEIPPAAGTTPVPAEQLADDLEKLGPAFVKIGQLLSTRGDLLPPAYLSALGRLQDDVSTVAYEEIERTIEEDLGVRISKAFENFERKPLAAASLGQVHLATLRGGRQVAIKVQRPGIRKQIADDIESLEAIASFLDEHTDFGRKYETLRIVEQFRSSVLRELDYQREAASLVELRENLKGFHRLTVPRVVDDYSSGRVLTMDYVPGTKITSLSGAVLNDLDGDALAGQLFQAYLKQILVDGFFHADPHPGNLLLTHDRRIGILDLGMTGRVQQRMRDQLVHLLAGISEGNGIQTAEAALGIGEAKDEELNREGFITAVEEIVGSSKSQALSQIDIGSLVLQVTRACADAGLRIPAEISMIGKALMNLDRVGRCLSPGFDPHEAIREHLGEISRARIKETLTSANIMGILTELKQFLGQLPLRANRIMDLLADNKIKVRVDSIDEKALIVGLQKVANRITLGLILAALIVGSSMLARVETSFRLFGYPGLAMVFFLIAAAGAMILFFQIALKDR
ncbi:ABC1 kinase family protein [Luteolibacter luteus]|uniref:AarF/ABC1/UbiB kinase family protein n=1 Tax=Luteolibacter luteus TaxID=2728835 RepID=A0A858RFY3_9BACT|nr:AarF/UbiB family protein [Luteolibacter luteus]QJE95757.1 AarF/ABC1/UbiB kinase family protein [Luteolibacter luteus]